MKPHLRRARRPRPLVILTTGWAGEHALVRLLSADGAVRSSGYWLETARRRPEADLRSFLRSRTDEAVHAVLVQPGHIWALNHLDPYEAVARLADDGIALVSLQRRSAVDSGLSRALCGPQGELLPATTKVVEPADVVIHGRNAQQAASWLDEVMPADRLRILFEDDLTSHDARAATVTRLAARLSLEPWSPPPEAELPTAESLWRRVANPGPVRAAVDRITTAGRGVL
jgi:hypothetical protein